MADKKRQKLSEDDVVTPAATASDGGTQKAYEELCELLQESETLSDGNIDEVLEGIQSLLERYPQLFRMRDQEGNLPIHLACLDCKCPAGVVQFLLDKWPDSAHETNLAGCLPIHQCYFEGTTPQEDVMQLIVAAYPDGILCSADEYESPMAYAADDHGGGFWDNQTDILKLMAETYIRHHHHHHDHREKINQFFMQFGMETHNEVALPVAESFSNVYPNFCRQEMDAVGTGLPLHRLAAYGYVEPDVLQAWIDMYPESIELLNNPRDCQTPLHVFLNNRESEAWDCVDVLCNSTVLQTKDSNGRLPLHLACQRITKGYHRDRLYANFVRGFPASLVSTDKDGNTPLMLACQSNLDVNVIYFLLRNSPSTWIGSIKI